MAFSEGGQRMSDMKTVLHADSVKCSKKGREEIHASHKPLPTLQGGRAPIYHYLDRYNMSSQPSDFSRLSKVGLCGPVLVCSPNLLLTVALNRPKSMFVSFSANIYLSPSKCQLVRSLVAKSASVSKRRRVGCSSRRYHRLVLVVLTYLSFIVHQVRQSRDRRSHHHPGVHLSASSLA